MKRPPAGRPHVVHASQGLKVGLYTSTILGGNSHLNWFYDRGAIKDPAHTGTSKVIAQAIKRGPIRKFLPNYANVYVTIQSHDLSAGVRTHYVTAIGVRNGLPCWYLYGGQCTGLQAQGLVKEVWGGEGGKVPGAGGYSLFRGMYQPRTAKLQPPVLAVDSPWIFNVQIYSPLFSEKPNETPFKSTSFEKLLCFIASDPTNH